MATATSTQPTTVTAEPDQCVVMREIGWEGYNRVLRLRAERPRPRMVYLDGDLYLMSPGHSHERDKDRFLLFVVEVTVGLRIPFHLAGSTTYRRRKKDGGIEPDQSFYLANAAKVRNKKAIQLKTDPPPDLSIEVVYSNSSAEAVEVSRRFGIPEVWVCTETSLTFLVLGPDGNYEEKSSSLAFPFLSAAEVLQWIRKPEADDASDLDWTFDLRRWVQETLIPRVAQRDR